MVRTALLSAILVAVAAGIAPAKDGPVGSIEVKQARPQVPLLGEVRESRIPKSIFYKKRKEIVNGDLLLMAGYLTKTDKPFGEIIHTQTDAEGLSSGDTVVINRGAKHGVRPGGKYYIYRNIKKVRHPETRKRFGHVVSIVGVLEVTGVTYQKINRIGGGYEPDPKALYSDAEGVKELISTAKIVKAYDAIFVGDYIIPEFNVRVPMIDPDRPLEEKEIRAVVMAVTADKESAAENDVLYLDVGRMAGVMEGDVFGIYKKPARKSVAERYDIKRGVAKARVIMVRPYTSTAVVFSSKDEIFAGYLAGYLQER
ncbi:MAG: hypothetical protein IEMM0002_0056 [bacterium]|nr:MAG: hypothetical protein IEMM0002_0056 [bacterium]